MCDLSYIFYWCIFHFEICNHLKSCRKALRTKGGLVVASAGGTHQHSQTLLKQISKVSLLLLASLNIVFFNNLLLSEYIYTMEASQNCHQGVKNKPTVIHQNCSQYCVQHWCYLRNHSHLMQFRRVFWQIRLTWKMSKNCNNKESQFCPFC